jgi:hypothetical protein
LHLQFDLVNLHFVEQPLHVKGRQGLSSLHAPILALFQQSSFGEATQFGILI